MFSILFIYFGIAYIWPMYHSLAKKIWFIVIFKPLKESHSGLDVDFYYNFTYFVPTEVIEDKVTKNSKYVDGKRWPLDLP